MFLRICSKINRRDIIFYVRCNNDIVLETAAHLQTICTIHALHTRHTIRYYDVCNNIIIIIIRHVRAYCTRDDVSTIFFSTLIVSPTN